MEIQNCQKTERERGTQSLGETEREGHRVWKRQKERDTEFGRDRKRDTEFGRRNEMGRGRDGDRETEDGIYIQP